MRKFLNHTTRSVAWLKNTEAAGKLELKPPFQRNPVWTDRQKSYLIDTILHGYPVPEIYMQELVDEDGNERFVVVDGQQRIRSCLDFIRGKFQLDPDDVPDWADYAFDDLTEKDKRKFFEYNFLVRVLPNVSDEELRNIFRRLNRNVVALNKQELRHSTYWGSFIQSMEGLADLPYWSTSGVFTANDVRRMLDVEFVSELAVATLHGLQNKKQKLDEWYVAYEEDFEERAALEATFGRILGELEQVLPNIKDTRWRKKSDFYTLFNALSGYEKQFPLSKVQRAKLQKTLVAFSQSVDKYMAADKSGKVANYIRAPFDQLESKVVHKST